MSSDLTCVHRAMDLAEADIVVAWLADQGIDALVKDRYSVGTLQTPLIVAPRGIEVCIADPAVAERAAALLREHAAAIKDRVPVPDSAVPIEARCEKCGRSCPFPAEQAGTVQTCPHCRAYVDVPAYA